MKTAENPLLTPARPSGMAARASLQRDTAMHLGVAGVLVAGLAGALAGATGWGVSYVAQALGFYMVGAVLIWRGLHSHPFGRFGAANRVTLARMAVLSMLAALVWQAGWEGWVLVAVATGTALLDAVDGALARRSGLASDFGARFDMETDAAFILVLCVLVVQSGQAGAWLLLAGLMRYLFVAAAFLWPWLGGPLRPSRRRQTVCVLQVVALIVCLAPVVAPPLSLWLAAASLGLLTLSFAIDVRALALQRPAI
ncbi:MAG: CDP-alcohol phosphatidyltransferase family protein [Serpentinimonas sp.]|nr:CDP-alcohol phosphatidyltransferase family protein [Serpentinimonas sp.]